MQSNKIELIKQIIIIALIVIVPFITIKTIYFIESSSDKRDAKLINLSTLTGDSNLCFKIKNKEGEIAKLQLAAMGDFDKYLK